MARGKDDVLVNIDFPVLLNQVERSGICGRKRREMNNSFYAFLLLPKILPQLYPPPPASSLPHSVYRGDHFVFITLKKTGAQ